MQGGIAMAMVRFGQLGQLKPDKIEEYCTLHANPWPGVLKTITECNLRNYSIYLHGDKVFAYFEYVGEDYEADMKKMEQCPITQEWWTHTKPCFIKYAIDPASEFYHDMKPIFYYE
jgi:L-rhamnose mutarotase